jgi:hypothetical protein
MNLFCFERLKGRNYFQYSPPRGHKDQLYPEVSPLSRERGLMFVKA